MHKVFFKIGILASLFFITSCSSDKKEEPSQPNETSDPDLVEFTKEQYNTVGVQLGSIIYTNLSNYVKASGTVSIPPKDLISITSPYGGTIKFTDVIEGKFVRKGQLIATIENPEFVQVQQDYLESNSQLTYLRQNLSRQDELVKENIAARKSLQQAQSEYNSMRARVEGLKSKLRIFNIDPTALHHDNVTSRANIYAPSNGYITHVYSNAGKYIGANELLADMANTSNILIKVKVFEKDLPQIKVGQTIRFRATGDSVERNAEVFLIGKDIDTDRTVEVHGRIINPSPALLPGMFINAIMEVGATSTSALPEPAIVQAGGKNYIFAVEQKNSKDTENSPTGKDKHISFRRFEVGTGASENGYTAVILPDKFDLKSKIVLKGAYDLLSKMNNSEEEE